MTSRRHDLAAVIQVLRLFARRRGTRWTARAALETSRVVSVDGKPWRVWYKVHAVPAGTLRVEVRSSITLWPVTLRKRPGWKRGGWSAALRKKRWYQECQQQLGQHGYEGRWQASPWGRFGDFWKPLKDTAAVLAEIERIEQLGAESFGAWEPSNDRLPPTKPAPRRVARRRRAGGTRDGVTWFRV